MIRHLQYAFGLLLPESDPYHPWEKRFLSDPGCMPRYCRAAKWKMDNAKERIKGTIEWRREYKPDLIKPDEVKIVSMILVFAASGRLLFMPSAAIGSGDGEDVSTLRS